MMSLKIRLLTFIVESLIRYQRHLETQQWLKAQRQQRWRVEGLNIHIAKDIGADADGRFRTKLDQVERPAPRASKASSKPQGLAYSTETVENSNVNLRSRRGAQIGGLYLQ